jgi:hypothetical protein
MAMYVFSTTGEPVGFVFESLIYDLEGTPLGRIIGARVHRFDGSFAGDWFHNMVVERTMMRPRPIRPLNPPARKPAMSPCPPRRPVAEHRAYPDAFARLYEISPEQLAAE